MFLIQSSIEDAFSRPLHDEDSLTVMNGMCSAVMSQYYVVLMTVGGICSERAASGGSQWSIKCVAK